MATTETPVGRMLRRYENAQRDVAALDQWLKEHEESHCDWEYQYRELRLARRRVTRTHKAALRLDLAINGENIHARQALEAIDGRMTLGPRIPLTPDR